jgi:outer membrane protein OmpA-like peptidoglycan-associated protein
VRYPLAILLVLQFAGCATDEALFAQYDRPCPVPTVRYVPELASAVAVAVAEGRERTASFFEPAVFFAHDSAALDGSAQATLARVVELLRKRQRVHLFLRAQTDWRGSPVGNEALAERRLTSVRRALLDAGIPERRLRGVGIGERETVERASEPVMDAARRVDLEFVDGNGRPLPIRLGPDGIGP